MATKKKAVQLATEIFDKGYATGTWYKKFSKATAAETKPKKARKKAVKKVEKATLEGRPGVPKPKKRTRSSILYWSDIETYVKKKYDKDFRDWLGSTPKMERTKRPSIKTSGTSSVTSVMSPTILPSGSSQEIGWKRTTVLLGEKKCVRFS